MSFLGFGKGPGSRPRMFNQNLTAAFKRCEKKFKELGIADKYDDKKFLPRPEKRRITLAHINDPKHRVTVWAYDLDTGAGLELEAWETNFFGKNKDIDKGMELRFESGGILKRTKITTFTKSDSVILWRIG